MTIESIRALWDEHQALAFPLGHRSKTIGGSNLTVLHSEIGGYILGFLQTNGSLGSRQRGALEHAISLLDALDGELEGEGKAYFAGLNVLAKKVYEMAHSNPSM